MFSRSLDDSVWIRNRDLSLRISPSIFQSRSSGIHGDALAGGHLDLDVSGAVEGVVSGMRGRIERQPERLRGDDLSDRADEVTVRRELAARVGGFEFRDGLIDGGHGAGEFHFHQAGHPSLQIGQASLRKIAVSARNPLTRRLSTPIYWEQQRRATSMMHEGTPTMPKKNGSSAKLAQIQVDMFDVDLGAAMLLQFRNPDGTVVRILADGGLSQKKVKLKLPGALTDFKAASQHIDLMVGTHYDADHLDGLVEVVNDKAIEIGEAWLPPVADNSVPHASDEAPKDADMLAIKFGGPDGETACWKYLTAKFEACNAFAEYADLARSGRDIPDQQRDGRPNQREFPKSKEGEWLSKARRFFEDHERQAREELGTTGGSHADDDAEIPMSVSEISRRLSPFWPRYWFLHELRDAHLKGTLPREAVPFPIIRNLAHMRLRAAREGINAASLRLLVEALHEKKVPIRCRYIDDGEPRRLCWSQSTHRFEVASDQSDGILLTLLGPSEGLIGRHRTRLPAVDYAAYALSSRIEIKGITPSNQLSSAFIVRYREQGILVSGDTGFVDFPVKPRSRKYHPRLIAALEDIAVVQVAHHGGANAHFYRALQKANSPLAQPASFLLLSHGSDDPHRPSAEFSYYVGGAKRDDRKAYVLFTGKPRAERIADIRPYIYRRAGPIATGGDLRLIYGDNAWVVEKHAVDVSENEDVGKEAERVPEVSTPRSKGGAAKKSRKVVG